MADALRSISTRSTPQSQRATPEQRKNAAGGYVFTLKDDLRLNRFLTMGVTGSTFYVGERELASDAGELVTRWAREKGAQLLERIYDISLAGRAPKVNPVLFALAAASALGDDQTRTMAYNMLPAVARTGSHLFTWAQYRSQFAGVGRGYRRAVSNWYLGKPEDKMAYQMVKYRQREGWDHRRLIDLSHPVPDTAARDGMFRWAKGLNPFHVDQRAGEEIVPDMPAIWVDYLDAKAATKASQWIEIVGRGHGLSWEMLPDEALTQPAVWEALIEVGLPMTALFRQLPRLTRLGVLKSSHVRARITTDMTDPALLKRARVHPINVLIAARTYQGGQGKGSSWEPDVRIVDAYDEAFYQAFGAVQVANKRTLIALDTSGSMGQAISGGGNARPGVSGRGVMREPDRGELSCRELAAAMALVQMKTEPEYEVIGFTGLNHQRYRQGTGQLGSNDPAVSRLTLSSRQRLDDAVRYVDTLPYGPTDCALPMLWAQDQGVKIDTFILYTDNQTWAGKVHPHQALRRYRETVNPSARLIVVGMAGPLWVSIADPNDPLSLDVAGFDSAVPNLINDFSRGDV